MKTLFLEVFCMGRRAGADAARWTSRWRKSGGGKGVDVDDPRRLRLERGSGALGLGPEWQGGRGTCGKKGSGVEAYFSSSRLGVALAPGAVGSLQRSRAQPGAPSGRRRRNAPVGRMRAAPTCDAPGASVGARRGRGASWRRKDAAGGACGSRRKASQMTGRTRE